MFRPTFLVVWYRNLNIIPLLLQLNHNTTQLFFIRTHTFTARRAGAHGSSVLARAQSGGRHAGRNRASLYIARPIRYAGKRKRFSRYEPLAGTPNPAYGLVQRIVGILSSGAGASDSNNDIVRISRLIIVIRTSPSSYRRTVRARRYIRCDADRERDLYLGLKSLPHPIGRVRLLGRRWSRCNSNLIKIKQIENSADVLLRRRIRVADRGEMNHPYVHCPNSYLLAGTGFEAN